MKNNLFSYAGAFPPSRAVARCRLRCASQLRDSGGFSPPSPHGDPDWQTANSFFESHLSFQSHLRFHILKSEISAFLRMSVTLGDPLAGFSSTTRSVSNTLRRSDSVITS